MPSPTSCAACGGPHRINVHYHCLPPVALTTAATTALQRRIFAMWMDPSRMVDELNGEGVATAMLSFSTPQQWFPDLKPDRRFSRICNDHCTVLKQDHPGRFGVFATLPPPTDPDGTLAEIAYALDTLGAEGVTLMTNYEGRYLGDPAFAPVLEELDRRGAIAFVHPAEPICLMQTDAPSPYAEWPFDTARTIMSLWISDALSRWPNIRFIFSHGGGGLPMVAGRINNFGRPEPGTPGGEGSMRHDALTLFRRLYFDTANAANPPALAATRAMVDPDHVLFGTDGPYMPAEWSIDGLAQSNLTPEEVWAIERGNAEKLMPQLAAPAEA